MAEKCKYPFPDPVPLPVVDSHFYIHRNQGGGFDRNLWNAKTIDGSIGYIKANPVRSRLVAASEEWSSAYARVHSKEIVPDTFALPVVLKNSQAPRSGHV